VSDARLPVGGSRGRWGARSHRESDPQRPQHRAHTFGRKVESFRPDGHGRRPSATGELSGEGAHCLLRTPGSDEGHDWRRPILSTSLPSRRSAWARVVLCSFPAAVRGNDPFPPPDGRRSYGVLKHLRYVTTSRISSSVRIFLNDGISFRPTEITLTSESSLAFAMRSASVKLDGRGLCMAATGPSPFPVDPWHIEHCTL